MQLMRFDIMHRLGCFLPFAAESKARNRVGNQKTKKRRKKEHDFYLALPWKKSPEGWPENSDVSPLSGILGLSV